MGQQSTVNSQQYNSGTILTMILRLEVLGGRRGIIDLYINSTMNTYCFSPVLSIVRCSLYSILLFIFLPVSSPNGVHASQLIVV